MKIHVLSDIHLEHGPYCMPKGLKFDVMVVPGDISPNPKQAIEFLKSVGKPVVMVLGNHDYWSDGKVDMEDRLEEFRSLAAGTNVHVLENEHVIIGDTRFLGCTLWTSYCDENEDLMHIAWRSMNDYHQINSQSWHNKHPVSWPQWLRNKREWFDKERANREFNPLVAYEKHQESVNWLEIRLSDPPEGHWQHTVVVTHHAPSWRVLAATGEIMDLKTCANPLLWKKTPLIRGRDENNIYRLAAYASPMDDFLRRHGNARSIDIWCHGHVHTRSDIMLNGIRTICNPRGYAWGNGNPGDGWGNERLTFNPAEHGWPVVFAHVKKTLPVLQEHLGQMKEMAPHLNHPDPVLRRCVSEAFDQKIRAIHDEQAIIDARIGEAVFYRPWNPSLPYFLKHRQPGLGIDLTMNDVPLWTGGFDKLNTPSSALRSIARYLRNLVKIERLPAAIAAFRRQTGEKLIDELEKAGFMASIVDGNDIECLKVHIVFPPITDEKKDETYKMIRDLMPYGLNANIHFGN